MTKWYVKLFENYGETYDKEAFTFGTLGECDFLEREFRNDRSLRILDVGCGTGRHSIELAKRGYRMTGIDYSKAQLAKAVSKANEQHLTIDFQEHDARNLPFDAEFDAAIMLCEGGFPLMETDEMNFEILKSVAKSLKQSATFVFTTLNGLYPLFHSINDFHGETPKDGATYRSSGFDYMTLRDHSTTTYTDDAGATNEIESNERYYLPSEITWLLQSLSFTSIEIFGAKLGAFSREDRLTPDDYEMLVIAKR
jgi:SAM-dependent methyltransferase